jgi:hypothetical protein
LSVAQRSKHTSLWFLGAVVTAATVGAHVRLAYPSNGAPLYWSNPANLSLVINSDGSDDINDGSEVTAIRNAISAWNNVGGTELSLAEDQSSAQRARRDWSSTDSHIIMFDENNDSGYFPGSSGIVALTPITFYTNGQIIDADILFNGGNYAFTTRGQVARFDVQDVATHELGHFVGLDHSGCAGATMYPYVDSTVILHRSLSIDDVRGARDIYPSATYGRIMGTLVREGTSSLVRGAHIVARDVNGRLAGATLTNSNGSFMLAALDSGNYTVYADPLDHPVSVANLGGGQVIDTDFGSTILGTIDVTAGATASLGTCQAVPDVAVSLGRVADDYPLRVIIGQSVSRLVRGSGLMSGATITASDPSILVTPTTWFGSSVQLSIEVPHGAQLGHADLVVTSGSGEVDILAGALEVTPPNPTVVFVSPDEGSPNGGDLVTVTGTNFRAGARVVIGNRIYVDGAVGGCTVVDASTITLTTNVTIGGLHDVVVIDASGVEGRMAGAFTVSATPSIATTFPTVGSSMGGTVVILTGANFVAGALVTIDDVVQANVTLDSPAQMTIVTGPGIVGGPYVVEVMNPGGASATTAFSYVDSPDPVLTHVTPDSGQPAGGETVTLMGAGFSAETRVVFGAHAKSGVGGVPAASVQVVDASTLRVVTPASSSMSETVLVRHATTGQASILASGFQFEQEPHIPSQGGFGGCGSIDPRDAGPPTPRRILVGAGWILALFAVALGQRAAALGRLRAPRSPASAYAAAA